MQFWDNEKRAYDMGAMLDLRARIAISMVERYGAVSGRDSEDEDSAGRKYIRKETPAEVVKHCADLAECLVVEFQQRGWIRPAPSIESAISGCTDYQATMAMQRAAMDTSPSAG